MRLAILADVHGNVEALRAVLADLDAVGVDGLAVCGDTVGYGPDPEEAVALLRSRGAAMVQGNHELALTRCNGLGWFNPTARCALEVTARLVSPQTVDFLGTLKKFLVLHGCRFVHGFPPDSAHTYLFAADQDKIVAAFGRMRQDICFVGHTHVIELVEFKAGRVRRFDPGRGLRRLDAAARHIVNVGSVGQPRDDWNRQAKYVVFDAAARTAEFRFVAYDSRETRRKILARGLPPRYAQILGG